MSSIGLSTEDRMRAAQYQGWRCDAVAKNECIALGLDYAEILFSSPLERIGVKRLLLSHKTREKENDPTA